MRTGLFTSLSPLSSVLQSWQLIHKLNRSLKNIVHILDSLLIPLEFFVITFIKFNIVFESIKVNFFLNVVYRNKNVFLIFLINNVKDIIIFIPNNVVMKKVLKTLTFIFETDLDELLFYHIVISENDNDDDDGSYYSTLLIDTTILKSL